ncbi:hypothetical protein ACWC24_36690 [Streptomyces sp. NPDC001443]
MEDEQDRRVHPLVLIGGGCGPAGAPHRLLEAVGVLLLPLKEPGVLVELLRDEGGFLGAVVDLDEQQRHPGLRGRSGRPAAGKRTGKKAAKAAAAPSASPTLVDLVREHLAGQNEPRSAAETATALGPQHPKRTIKTTVVRTTLEGLVAKSQAQRTKQGSSVFYTAADATQPTPAATESQPEPANP